MGKFNELVRSRKFQLLMGTVLTNIGGAVSGEMAWQTAIVAITGAVSAWMFAQGKVDAAKVTTNGTAAGGTE